MNAGRGRSVDVGIDVGIALLLLALATWLYAATSLHCIYGNDGAMLGDWTALPERAYRQYHNTLYLPCAELLRLVLPQGGVASADDPLWLAKSLSAIAGGFGLACCYGCCRALGNARGPSVFATALLAVTPGLWFFGAAIEVHTQHFAVVAATALLTLWLPWQRPALALPVACALFVLPYLSHQSAPTLGPAWILLIQSARRRVAPAFSWPALFGIGCVLLLALGHGHLLVQWQRGLGFAFGVGGVADTVVAWRRELTPTVVVEAVVAPLALWLPLAAWALVQRRVDGWLRASVIACYGPLTASVLWWGVAERGGYLLGPLFLLALLLAAAWPPANERRRGQWRLVMLLVVLGQAALAWPFVRGFDQAGAPLAARAERVASVLGERGLVLSCNDNAPTIALWLPTVQETPLLPTLANDAPLDVWIAGLEPVLQGLVAAGPVVLDVSYRLRTDLPDRVRDATQRLEQRLRERFLVTEHAFADWPLWRIAAK